MSSEEKACIEKPEKKENEEHENKRVMITFAVLLGLTIVIGAMLDFFFKGVPLGFIIPFVNVQATLSMVLYYVVVLFVSIYIGVVGLKELVVERRFSVEFLMAVAAIGALYLQAFLRRQPYCFFILSLNILKATLKTELAEQLRNFQSSCQIKPAL